MIRTKILILTANPSYDPTRSKLNLDREIREIKEVLRQSQERDRFEIASESALRPKDLSRVMLEYQPQIVHFSGHGSGETGLVLLDDRDRPKLVSTESLANLFRLSPGIECVLMNACYSESQAKEIRQYVDYVIGMSKAIGDSAAIEFARGFYEGLGAGKPIPEAFEWGKLAINLENIPETLTPQLLIGGSRTPAQTSVDGGIEQVTIALEAPEGAVRVDSLFCVRYPHEERWYEEIEVLGALIRVRSPQKMGKSSLAIRILNHARGKGYRTVMLDLQQTDKSNFTDLDKFIKWFCASVGKKLNVQVKLAEHWDDIFGPNDNCTEYFENYLLGEEKNPLVVCLENFDRVFQYNEIESDFCGLLRGWHERSKSDSIWSQLRLVIVYSQEPYLQRDINQSPFNVGVPIELGEFTSAQVQHLAHLHGLGWRLAEIEQLMELIGGHPYLVRLALYRIANQSTSLPELLQTAPTEAGMYQRHLLGHLKYLEQHPELGAAMKQVVIKDKPVKLRSQEAFKLDSMGLIKRLNNEVVPLCRLYRDYFKDRLE